MMGADVVSNLGESREGNLIRMYGMRKNLFSTILKDR